MCVFDSDVITKEKYSEKYCRWCGGLWSRRRDWQACRHILCTIDGHRLSLWCREGLKEKRISSVVWREDEGMREEIVCVAKWFSFVRGRIMADIRQWVCNSFLASGYLPSVDMILVYRVVWTDQPLPERPLLM